MPTANLHEDEMRFIEQRRSLSTVEKRVLDAILCAMSVKARKRLKLPVGVIPFRRVKTA